MCIGAIKLISTQFQGSFVTATHHFADVVFKWIVDDNTLLLPVGNNE